MRHLLVGHKHINELRLDVVCQRVRKVCVAEQLAIVVCSGDG